MVSIMGCDASTRCTDALRAHSPSHISDGGDFGEVEKSGPEIDAGPLATGSYTGPHEKPDSKSKSKKRKIALGLAIAAGVLLTLILLRRTLRWFRDRRENRRFERHKPQTPRSISIGVSGGFSSADTPTSASITALVPYLTSEYRGGVIAETTDSLIGTRMAVLALPPTHQSIRDVITGDESVRTLIFARAKEVFDGFRDKIPIAIWGRRALREFVDLAIATAIASDFGQSLLQTKIERMSQTETPGENTITPTGDGALAGISDKFLGINAALAWVTGELSRFSQFKKQLRIILLGKESTVAKKFITSVDELTAVFFQIAVPVLLGEIDALIRIAAKGGPAEIEAQRKRAQAIIGNSRISGELALSVLAELKRNLSDALEAVESISQSSASVRLPVAPKGPISAIDRRREQKISDAREEENARLSLHSKLADTEMLLRYAEPLLFLVKQAMKIADSIMQHGNSILVPELVRQFDLSVPHSILIMVARLNALSAVRKKINMHARADDELSVPVKAIAGTDIFTFVNDLVHNVILLIPDAYPDGPKRSIELAAAHTHGKMTLTVRAQGCALRDMPRDVQETLRLSAAAKRWKFAIQKDTATLDIDIAESFGGTPQTPAASQGSSPSSNTGSPPTTTPLAFDALANPSPLSAFVMTPIIPWSVLPIGHF